MFNPVNPSEHFDAPRQQLRPPREPFAHGRGIVRVPHAAEPNITVIDGDALAPRPRRSLAKTGTPESERFLHPM